MTLQHVRGDIDYLAVQFVVNGTRMKLNRAEQAEAVKQLNGTPIHIIADLLGCNQRWVSRLRVEQGLVE